MAPHCYWGGGWTIQELPACCVLGRMLFFQITLSYAKLLCALSLLARIGWNRSSPVSEVFSTNLLSPPNPKWEARPWKPAISPNLGLLKAEGPHPQSGLVGSRPLHLKYKLAEVAQSRRAKPHFFPSHFFFEQIGSEMVRN